MIQTTEQSTISQLFELPESLYKELQNFLEENKSWNVDRLCTVAISLFLMQQQSPGQSGVAAREYLAAWRGGE